jgi:hypothetical protein
MDISSVDLEQAVALIEARVPFGRPLIRTLLSLAIVCALLKLTQLLATQFVWPVIRFLQSLFAGSSPLPLIRLESFPALLSWGIAVVLVVASGCLIYRWMRRLELRLEMLKLHIRRVGGMSWGDLILAERRLEQRIKNIDDRLKGIENRGRHV